jgi:uncharacterized membrane protein YfcA
MILIGYLLGALMGLTLGLIGAGGSILTVPILVYLLSVKPVVATGYSLLVVGSAASAGAIRYWQNDLVNLRAMVLFAVPAMLMVLVTRTYIFPSIPEHFLGISKDTFVMLLFASLMICAAIFMLITVRAKKTHSHPLKPQRVAELVIGSAGVGLLTGMVGAGGGFLIIPTLIALFGLETKEAIGTSLSIIAINSLVGFNGDLRAGIPLDFPLLATFLGLTLFGMWLGTRLSKQIHGDDLRKIFGMFTLVIGLMVIAEQVFAVLK